jgi:hypothetical protein
MCASDEDLIAIGNEIDGQLEEVRRLPCLTIVGQRWQFSHVKKIPS